LVNDAQRYRAVVEFVDNSSIDIYVNSDVADATGSPAGALPTPAADLRVGGYREVAPTTLSSATGGAVADWDATNISDLTGSLINTFPDRTGNRDATQSTAADKPTYMAEGLNGRPCALFDDTNAYMTFTGLDLSSSDFHIWWVVEPSEEVDDSTGVRTLLTETAITANYGFVGFGAASGTLSGETFVSVRVIGGSNPGLGDDGSGSTGRTYTGGEAYIGEFSLSGSTETYKVNGAGVTLTDFNGGLNSGTSTSLANMDAIGGRAGGESLNGKIGRLIIFNRQLSTTEATYIREQLSYQWGINLDGEIKSRGQSHVDELRIKSSALTSAARTAFVATGDFMQPVGTTKMVFRTRQDTEPLTSEQ